MIGAGVMLMLKKEIDWIQPPSMEGRFPGLSPRMPMTLLVIKAIEATDGQAESYADFDRVDFKPSKGMVKFILKTGLEVQLDAATGDVLSVATRQSDWIEALHDGSYFADWVKLYVFLPAGLGLFILWATGLYLFTVIEIKKITKRRKKPKTR